MARSTKKSLLDDPATRALMKELGMANNKTPVATKKVTKRRGKPGKCPNVKTEIEKKKSFYFKHIQKQWKILYGTNRIKAADVPGWLRGFGSHVHGDDPELRAEMITLSNVARQILNERSKNSD